MGRPDGEPLFPPRGAARAAERGAKLCMVAPLRRRPEGLFFPARQHAHERLATRDEQRERHALELAERTRKSTRELPQSGEGRLGRRRVTPRDAERLEDDVLFVKARDVQCLRLYPNEGAVPMLRCMSMSDDKRAAADLRQEMTKLDTQLLALVERRAKLARDVGKLRGDTLPQLPADSRAALAALVAKASADLPADAVRAIFHEIHAACLALELGLTVATVGGAGGLTHVATKKRFGGPTKLVACDSAELATQAVHHQKAAFAVLPFETKADGLVQSTVTALLASDLRIVATFEATAELRLMSRDGKLTEISRVVTPSAEREIGRTLLAGLGKITVVDVDTAEEACALAKEDASVAALADETFGASVGLVACCGATGEPLSAVGDRARYAVLGTRPSGRTGTDATSVVFSVSDSPGALLEVLKQLADRGVNLTRIQSRPTPGDSWGYLFYVELVGHATDRNVVSALEDVKRHARFFKLLGSYAAS